MDKVKPVTDDDEWQLVSEFGFLSITHSDKDHIESNITQPIKHLYSDHKTSTYPDATGLIFYHCSDWCMKVRHLSE